MNDSMRRYFAELLGTFTLVFIGTAVATLQGYFGQGPAGWLGIAAAFGGTLMVMVWVVGPVSGCHLNPAVTLPMALSGRMNRGETIGYIVAQCVGGLLASLLLLSLLKGLPNYQLAQHGIGANGNPEAMSVGALFGWELVMTALFLFVIFTATRKEANGDLAAFAIGGFLFLAHLIGVPLGDSSLNPARSLGPALVTGGNALSVLWIFIVAPLIGGLVGWQLFRAVYGSK
jgi:aquaporin Z